MSRTVVRRILWANFVAQALIIVTGAVVRVTGSGLGCPTWPECVPGSFTPTEHQAESWHKFVEFGNRTLTFVLLAVAVAALVAVWKQTNDSKTRWLAATPLIGVLAQAIIGGITVLTGLHSIALVAHFLVSVWLVQLSGTLLYRVMNPDTELTNNPTRWVANLTLVSAFLVMFLGSFASASGPHSGDEKVPAALAIDPRITSWLHADAVWFFIGSLVAGWILRQLRMLSRSAGRLLHVLSALAVIQAMLGYIQYYNGVPVPLVAIHVAIATSFWCVAVLYHQASRRQQLSE